MYEPTLAPKRLILFF